MPELKKCQTEGGTVVFVKATESDKDVIKVGKSGWFGKTVKIKTKNGTTEEVDKDSLLKLLTSKGYAPKASGVRKLLGINLSLRIFGKKTSNDDIQRAFREYENSLLRKITVVAEQVITKRQGLEYFSLLTQSAPEKPEETPKIKFTGWEPDSKKLKSPQSEHLKNMAEAISSTDVRSGRDAVLNFIKQYSWLDAFRIISLISDQGLREVLLNELLNNIEGACNDKTGDKYASARGQLELLSNRLQHGCESGEVQDKMSFDRAKEYMSKNERFMNILGMYELLGR